VKLKAVLLMGIALIQTFGLAEGNTDSFSTPPDAAWLFILTEGLISFIYGFFGFWVCERRTTFWRLGLHCISIVDRSNQFPVALAITLVVFTIISGALVLVFETDKTSLKLVWSTFVVLGFMS
jgi:hypothetical protein